ncbi:MAG: hypothetical protein IT350_15515, partial [Deltaproteobacteria bacterium]|nr:hypothetical protein [Deltaproteobacteria bacterium]
MTLTLAVLAVGPAYGAQSGDAARDRLLHDNPGAAVNDGRLFDRPFSVSGFSPIESGGDYSTAFFAFVTRNGDLLSAGGGGERIDADMLKSAFGPAQIVYSCDRDGMEPLPALIDDEFYEPRCAEFTIVKFPQMIDGLPFVTRSMLAVFDKSDRLIAVQGEFVGGLSPDAAATVSEEQAAVSIETEFDADPSSLQYEKVELQYRYRDGIVPVWAFSGVVAGGRTYAEIAVNADSGEIVAIDTGIDHDPGDIDVWGYTIDDEAAYLCNEPALRKRRARTSFSSGTNRRAFNDNIHVYDLKANPDYPR